MAAQEGHEEIVQMLLENKADKELATEVSCNGNPHFLGTWTENNWNTLIIHYLRCVAW